MTRSTMKLTLGAALLAAATLFTTQQAYADSRGRASTGSRDSLAGRSAISYRGDRDGHRRGDWGRQGDRDRDRWSRGDHRPLRTIVVPRTVGRSAYGGYGYGYGYGRPVIVVPPRHVYRPQCERAPIIQFRLGW